MGVLAILGVLGLLGCGPSAGLPAAARQSAEKVFPGAQIQKVKMEEENGLQLYEVKLSQKGAKAEVTVAADGTVVETETSMAPDQLPKVVRDAVAQAAPGAKTVKAKREEVLADSKLAKLANPKVSFEIEVAKDGKEGELTVSADGVVTEPLKWEEGQRDDD